MNASVQGRAFFRALASRRVFGRALGSGAPAAQATPGRICPRGPRLRCALGRICPRAPPRAQVRPRRRRPRAALSSRLRGPMLWAGCERELKRRSYRKKISRPCAYGSPSPTAPHLVPHYAPPHSICRAAYFYYLQHIVENRGKQCFAHVMLRLCDDGKTCVPTWQSGV